MKLIGDKEMSVLLIIEIEFEPLCSYTSNTLGTLSLHFYYFFSKLELSYIKKSTAP